MIQPAGYNDSVFVNCPFDSEYAPLLKAIVFAIYRCGFLPKSALAEDNALDNRLDKISRLIEQCRYGIHDISRTELNDNGLPRFNMPFELGLFFGAKRFGNKFQKNKNALIFERIKFQYQKYISDINGIDTKAHQNLVETAIKEIRDWLKSASRRTTIPGDTILINEYNDFLSKLPGISNKLGFNIDEIPFNDYCTIVEEAIASSMVS
jgi:hypothetical protein